MDHQSRPDWAGPEARVLGRYVLGPSLGRGGMGEVWEAWDTLLGRRVALKTLTMGHRDAVARLLKEAQLQARVSHPNVCRIFDVDASGEQPVIAMQLVDGPNLQQAAPHLAADEAVGILAAVATAVNAAHRLNLIHRDLKPSNILLEPDGTGGWSTYVADFGLAKDLAAAAGETRTLMGTPEYLAPELQPGRGGQAGPATDIYALGMTLAAVLSRCRDLGPLPAPWARGPAPGTAPAVRDRWRCLPRRLRTIAARCLEERPQDRYSSAGELAEDLRRHLDGEPLLAERGERLRGLRRWLRRHPTWTASLGLSLALGTGFAVWSNAQTARSRRQAVLAQRFALDARDLENTVRVEQLIPVHDLRPAFARLRQGLDRLRAEMERLGPEASGPGRLALGRGYSALGDLDQARTQLLQAWAEGYRHPDLAYALSQVACEAYFGLLDRMELDDLEDPRDPALAAHRRDARTYFDLSRGQGWQPEGLALTRLLFLEGRYAEAAGQARAAFRDHPWLYEAKMEESFCLGALGARCQDRGDLPGARNHYREAALAARVAQGIGQSDSTCYLADLEWRIHWLKHPGLEAREQAEHLARCDWLADQLLILQPDSPRALLSKVVVLLRRAEFRAALGRDPEPDLRRAERLLDPAAERPECARMVARKRARIGELRRSAKVGEDPVPVRTSPCAEPSPSP
jgi:serine/threonine-protein kinase